MSQGLNKVMLMGNLGADPELRVTQGGLQVLTMRLATTASYLDKDKIRRERTDWHTVVVWGRRADALAKLLHKGARIFVEGSLRTSSYDDRDGRKRHKTEVVANDVLFTSEKGSGEGQDLLVGTDAPPWDAG
jgi:single-strand DNA-binding protein